MGSNNFLVEALLLCWISCALASTGGCDPCSEGQKQLSNRRRTNDSMNTTERLIMETTAAIGKMTTMASINDNARTNRVTALMHSETTVMGGTTFVSSGFTPNELIVIVGQSVKGPGACELATDTNIQETVGAVITKYFGANNHSKHTFTATNCPVFSSSSSSSEVSGSTNTTTVPETSTTTTMKEDIANTTMMANRRLRARQLDTDVEVQIKSKLVFDDIQAASKAFVTIQDADENGYADTLDQSFLEAGLEIEVRPKSWVASFEKDSCDDLNQDSDADGLCGKLDDCPDDKENDVDRDGKCANEDPCPEDKDDKCEIKVSDEIAQDYGGAIAAGVIITVLLLLGAAVFVFFFLRSKGMLKGTIFEKVLPGFNPLHNFQKILKGSDKVTTITGRADGKHKGQVCYKKKSLVEDADDDDPECDWVEC